MAELSSFFVEQAEASSHIQFVYDVPAGRVVFVNNAYHSVLGGNPAEVNAELPHLLARLHPDDRAFLAHYWQLWVRGQAADEVELRLQKKDAPDQWFCLTPFFQGTPEAPQRLGGALRNISAQKQYEENADRFNNRKNVTLEILSHDLSGAFVMVQQIVAYLQDEVATPPDSRVPELLSVLETTSQNSVKMIRDFVNLEFLTSTNTDLKRSRVDVGAVLREPLDELYRSKGLLGQYFDYTLPAEPVYANLDVNKFAQVITNLVGNALKFTPDGKRVLVHVAASPAGVRIQVIDEGIGIPAHLQPYLFDSFTQARRMGLRGEPTTGLGLALCKTIVEWHQGTISFASTEGVGTTFTVEIPQAEPRAK